MPTYNRIIMAPQKEENKKQKHSHRKLSKLAIKRLMREKRALQNVPHDAEIPEDLNINVDQAGDDVLEFIEPVINDICDSDNSNKNEPSREVTIIFFIFFYLDAFLHRL